MSNNKITIFTPTYNRAYTLPVLYDSLKKQLNQNFNWLVIDDGSTDNTRMIIKDYMNEADFKVEYIFKQNGGKHTAINLMLDVIETELVVIVDSDDYLDENAINIILNDYNQIQNKMELCSIIYLRAYFDGAVIGEEFPHDRVVEYANKYMINGGIRGDKCEVFFTHALKNYRFPVFEGERFIGETAVWIPLYRRYKSFFRNKAIYYCEYIEDGLSKAGKAMRIKNPLGGMANSKAYIANDIKLSLRIKNTLLFICYGKFAGKTYMEIKNEFPDKGLLIFMYPFGCLMYSMWKKKYRKK